MKKKELIIIDDNEVNNFICEKLIKSVSVDLKVKCYTDSVKALSEISALETRDNISIFLDLDIPVMDGLEFLNQLEISLEKINFDIFILSSSQNPDEIDYIKKNKNIIGFFSKPLTVEKIHEVLY